MKNLRYLLILFLVACSSSSFGFILTEGKSRKEIDKNILKLIYKKYGALPGYLYEYTPNRFYTLSKTGNALGVFDLGNTNDILSGWPLTSWPETAQMKGEGDNWTVRHLVAGALGGDTTEVIDPETMIFSSDKYSLPAFKTYIGCLADSPLRYGDVSSNGENELVLILDKDLVVFSPKEEKIIFATRFANSDELPEEDVAGWFEGGVEGPDVQYVASSGFGDGLRAAFPATRSFAKVFIDDFDRNGKSDIVVWRKLYQSRELADATKGFKLEKELFVHYQLEDGEYQLQTDKEPVEGEYPYDATQQEQIKGWLSVKNLTWQKGFPSKSECVGQEGQLIPEMHDPLLNDPDVLK